MADVEDRLQERARRCRDFRGQRVDAAFERGFVNGRRRIVRRIGEDCPSSACCGVSRANDAGKSSGGCHKIGPGGRAGSTLSVYPASSLPLMAAQRGIPYVIINRGATNHDGDESVSLRLDGDVAEIPPSVDIALRRKR